MEQRQREVLMREFRSGSSRVLITTDLVARGIDRQQVLLVINYDLPTTREDYLRRLGRGDGKGVVISFVATDDDMRTLKDIERECGRLDLMMQETDFVGTSSCRILQHVNR